MKTNTLHFFGLSALVGITLVHPAFGMISIDYVEVGNAFNLADPATGSLYGAVPYAYKSSQNETTISQYAAFLNAVAATDTYGLYDTSMASTSYIAGITRDGVAGSYAYSVVPGSENKPITYVSWFDAARFCNWLHHGQPIGLQTTGTTEDGAYNLAGAVSGTGFSVQPGAKAWIPSESEWYKAAYYDPNKGGVGVGGYWAQATQNNTLAGNTVGVANSANYNDGDYVGYPGAALTDVGAYGANSDSFYGTNDQAGNVYEWNDAVIDAARGLRGGAWNGPGDGSTSTLGASARYSLDPSLAFDTLGFRVAIVPESTAGVLTMLAGGMLLIRRKR